MTLFKLEVIPESLSQAFKQAQNRDVIVQDKLGSSLCVMVSYESYMAMQARLNMAASPDEYTEMMGDRTAFLEGKESVFGDVRDLLRESPQP